MTREDREIWECTEDDERLDAYRDALERLRDMTAQRDALAAVADRVEAHIAGANDAPTRETP